MDGDFLVLKWEVIESKLSCSELDLFYDLLNKITEDETYEDEYCVFPKAYIDGYRAGREFDKAERKEKKEKLLKELEELGNLKDTEIAHAEADEAIIKYIADKEITKAFDNVNKDF